MIPGCNSKSGNQPVEQANEPVTERKIKINDLQGNPIDLDQYRGMAVFINLWATWCGPCIKEMPSIERAQTILKDKRIEFLMASNESVEDIQAFSKKKNLDLHYVHLQNLEELNVQALPTTLILSPAGTLIFSETGFREWDDSANIALLNKIIESHE